MPRVRLLLAMLLVCGPLAGVADAQEPASRAEMLREEREKKAASLEPPTSSTTERLLLDLESGRYIERLLNPPEGLYPKIGNVTAGSGISFGPGFREPSLFGSPFELTTYAAASFKKYWLMDVRVRVPVAERVLVEGHGQKFDFPEEEFFGLGPDSNREDLVLYGLRNSIAGGTVNYLANRWLTFSGGIDFLAPRVSASDDQDSIAALFTEATAPGLSAHTDFVRYQIVADVNRREPRGNPRAGGRYSLVAQRYDDLDGSRYSFTRLDADVQQFIPLLRDRRVLAVRALASVSDADAGAEIPFYFQRTLGGPDDLRGFRRYRFRDRHALLLQAEYRWEIFTALDGAIFYDAGKVASRIEDLNFRDMESDYGIGFRFGTRNGVFLRVEGAFGSSGGKHFIFRFGDVF